MWGEFVVFSFGKRDDEFLVVVLTKEKRRSGVVEEKWGSTTTQLRGGKKRTNPSSKHTHPIFSSSKKKQTNDLLPFIVLCVLHVSPRHDNTANSYGPRRKRRAPQVWCTQFVKLENRSSLFLLRPNMEGALLLVLVSLSLSLFLTRNCFDQALSLATGLSIDENVIDSCDILFVYRVCSPVAKKTTQSPSPSINLIE